VPPVSILRPGIPQSSNYFFAQQSSAQQDEPCSQQFVPQHAPVQHFAPGVQQFSLVKAIAESDESARTNTANNLNFMEVSSRFG